MTSAIVEGFGELRSRLHQPPSAAAWEAVLRWFDASSPSPSEAIQAALAYAQDHLARWPPHLRVASWEPSRQRPSPDDLTPGQRLARAWHLRALSDAQPPARWASIAAQAHALHMGVDIGCVAPSTWLFDAPMNLYDGATLTASEPLDVGSLGAWREVDWPALRALWIVGVSLRASTLDALIDGLEPRWRALRELALPYNALAEEGASRLAAAPLDALRRLNVADNQLSPAAARQLARAPWWPRLEALHAGYQPVGDAIIEALCADHASAASGLSSLRLRGAGVTHEGLARLTRQAADRLPLLHEIDLLNHDLTGAPALRWLLSGALGEALRCLQLGRVQLLGEHVEALSRASAQGRFASLQALGLRSSMIGAEGVLALAERARLPGLRALDLGHCALGAQGASSLARASWAPHLQRVSLGHNRLTELGVDALVSAWPERGRLLALDLSGNALGDLGVWSLVDWPALQSVEILNLSDNGIGPRGARWLARSCALPNLRALDLRGNPLGEQGAAALLEAPWLAQLQELRVRRFDVGVESLGLLSAGAPRAMSARRLPSMGPA